MDHDKYKGCRKKNSTNPELGAKRIVAIDPNKRDLIFVASENDAKDGHSDETFRYTNQQRKVESGAKLHRKKQWKLAHEHVDGKMVRDHLTELSKFNHKTVDLETFLVWLTKKNATNALLFPHYAQWTYRQMRFRAFQNRKRSEANMINRFKRKFGGPEDTVVCMGDYSKGGGGYHMKFQEPTLRSGMNTIFRKAGYQVLLVDEHRTSKCCFNCKHVDSNCKKFLTVENPRSYQRDKYPTVIRHGLVKCTICDTLWNRDRNASLNILYLAQQAFQGKSRPKYLSRETKKE